MQVAMNQEGDVAHLPEKRRGIGRAPAIAAGLAGTIPLLVLCGWALESERLKAFVPGLPVMNPVTAVCLLGDSRALLLLARRDAAVSRVFLGRVLTLAVLLIGATKLLGLIFGWDLPFEHWLFAQSIEKGRVPSRIRWMRTAIDLVSAAALLF